MKTVRRRMIALGWVCLLMVACVSWAQTSKDASALPQENKTPAPAEENQAAQAPQDKKTPTAPQNLPNAPSSTTSEPSLTDLGFPTEQTQGDAKQQALLDKRTHMLKIHQRMGLITTIPLIVTVATSLNAGGKSTSSASRDLHTALGGLTGDLYFITAYYAIRAPRVPGTETRGPIRFHKAMAWIHGPGMILTPILGIIAFDQKNKGEKVHGIASAHGPVAIVTAGAFGAALSWSFTTLAVAAKNVMTSVPDYLVIETAFTTVQWVMVGPLTALAFAGPAQKATTLA